MLLSAVGAMVMVLSQVWLFMSIWEDDQDSFILSLISGWYRIFYLYSNPELTWRPGLLALVGFLMMGSGLILFASNLNP